MFVAFLFIPVVAGNVFMEGSIPNIPEITERQSVWTQDYTIFDPCNTNKPGNRNVSCSQLKRKGFNVTGIYEIYILGKPKNVTCDMTSDGGGWTVIQRRSEDEEGEKFFERNLTEYERGFGTAGGSFWIGLDNLHAMMSFPNGQQALRIVLDISYGWGKKTVVHYRKFYVDSKNKKYNLTIEEYDHEKTSKGYDAFSGHNGHVFDIKKGDQGTCRNEILSGGWWFKKCNEANLNGRKLGVSTAEKPGITWIINGEPKSYQYTYKKVEMQIRDADFDFCTGSLKF
uniref:Putative ficolin/ixoderin n=1 Tax=Ixodes ricinus TaxID=34613 RepID=A0A6B0V8X7_IXORI